VEVKPPDTTPVIRDEAVEYPAPDQTYAVRTAIEAVVSDLQNLQKIDNLVDFLNAVARHYKKNFFIQNALILKQTAQEFGQVIRRAKELRLPNELSAAEVKALVELSKESINETEFRNRVESAQREIEERARLPDAAKCAKGNLDRWLRNLSAHGGLSYILIDKVGLSEGKIVEVVYRRDLLQPLLDELMRQCKLKNR
jgi:hypothetical protein